MTVHYKTGTVDSITASELVFETTFMLNSDTKKETNIEKGDRVGGFSRSPRIDRVLPFPAKSTMPG